MKIQTQIKLIGCLAVTWLLGSVQFSQAGTRTWDFSTDPAADLEIAGSGNVWQQADGNP